MPSIVQFQNRFTAADLVASFWRRMVAFEPSVCQEPFGCMEPAISAHLILGLRFVQAECSTSLPAVALQNTAENLRTAGLLKAPVCIAGARTIADYVRAAMHG